MFERDVVWQWFLSPALKFLIDEQALRRDAESVDWEGEISKIRDDDVVIPTYYKSDTYLSVDLAVSYDAIAQYVLPPNQEWIYQAAIDLVRVKPRRILDLGCGTGTMTLMWKQAFPEAEVIGLDLSPYMLVWAAQKGHRANLKLQWIHGNAQKTRFDPASFDLVTASFLLQEMPVEVSQSVVREAWRLLKVGGQVMMMTVNHSNIPALGWLIDPLLTIPENVAEWIAIAGFSEVRSHDVWWFYQVCDGIKPLANQSQRMIFSENQQPLDFFPAPAFDTSS